MEPVAGVPPSEPIESFFRLQRPSSATKSAILALARLLRPDLETGKPWVQPCSLWLALTMQCFHYSAASAAVHCLQMPTTLPSSLS